MEVLRSRGRLSDLHVVAGAELQETLDACAGVLGALPFVAVREQQDQTGQKVPFVFPGDDELVDDDLRAVGEIAELRFPHHQRLRKVAGVPVFKAHDGGFGQFRVVDFNSRLTGSEVTQRYVFLPVSYTHLRAHETDSYP